MTLKYMTYNIVICQVYLTRKYIPIVILFYLIYMPTFLASCPYNGDTTI